ncbi:hypothetical protein [uncultured Caulobacter sp.]|jgi:hypothetical protein|uniref:hypothetical protein n=1 Tax=uncultured Caulobacter sp. TaxID=158749 RepID=UPI00261928AC|nr:hypothetical protein [uncultured Caulobacter sp.]
MLHIADLNSGERRTLATLARLGDGQALVPQCEEVARAAARLAEKGVARMDGDESDGYRLTTQGHALAEGL